MSTEEQFDFYWKEIFGGLAYNPIEFNTYRFDQSMSLPSKFNKLYEMFKVLALNNQEVMDYLKEFVETFDEKLYGTIEDILSVWLENGTLNDIILEVLQSIETNLNLKIKNYPIDVTYYGADPTGLIPINTVINNLILDNPNRTILFPKGEYLVDVDESILIENTTIDLLFEGATLKATSSAKERYYMFKCVNSSFSARGGKFIGDRMCHQGTTGEWGYCFAIQGCKDVYIENNDISMFWGDGIGIYQTSVTEYDFTEEREIIKFVNSTNVNILNNNIYECRRQGISVISVEDCYIKNNKIHHINGTSPQCAIDIEPNSDSIVRNVYVEQNELYENLRSGVDIVKRTNITNVELYNIFVLNNEIHHNKERGIFTNNVSNVVISGNIVRDNISNGIVFGLGINAIIANNQTHRNSESGIVLTYSDYCVVENNISSENISTGVSLLKATHNSINNNLLSNNMGVGLNMIQQAHDNIITSNKFVDNSDGGTGQIKAHLRIDFCNRNYFTNNMFRSRLEDTPTQYGIQITGLSNNNTITNNDLFQSGSVADINFPPNQQTLFGAGNRSNTGLWEVN